MDRWIDRENVRLVNGSVAHGQKRNRNRFFPLSSLRAWGGGGRLHFCGILRHFCGISPPPPHRFRIAALFPFRSPGPWARGAIDVRRSEWGAVLHCASNICRGIRYKRSGDYFSHWDGGVNPETRGRDRKKKSPPCRKKK
mmetsp:Transcript_34999/g.104386  ORF Transcript_34999/g.104386 Transcript_34999/m.104386 type:complete len:140 (+) Transcript_34999:281-700(+)